MAFLGLLMYINLERADYSAQKLMETGPGYLNGAVPNEKDISLSFDDVTVDEVLRDFNQFTDILTMAIADNEDQLTWLEINNSPIGIVRLYRWDFPMTVMFSSPIDSGPRVMFYKNLDGYDDTIIVASMDQQSLQNIEAAKLTFTNLIIGSPLILIFSGLFGLFISRITINPISKIAVAAEKISAQNLMQRVPVVSNDEIGSLARSINRMADRIEAAFDAQNRFISDAAHELRTPVASIKIAVTRALITSRNCDDYERVLRVLSERITNMEKLIEDLLLLSRTEEKSLRYDETPFNLSAVVDEIGEAFQCLFEDKGINFAVSCQPGLFVKGERGVLLRAISNLLVNATKHTPPGGSATFKAYSRDNLVLIDVEDTGHGISSEHLGHIFERFYKIPNTVSSEPSTGLGLAISKSIMKSMGGGINVRSKLGEGSVFTIWLPSNGNDLKNPTS